MRRIIYTIGILGAIGLSFTVGHPALAARFDLSPATAGFIAGCDAAVNININTEGRISDAANILIHYNPALVEIVDANSSAAGIQIRNGNAYEAYADNIVLPAAGLIRLTGFSFIQHLSDQGLFGTIIFRGRPGVTSADFTIDYLAGSTTDSNIAEYLTSDDLLTGVANGSYTFRSGSCVADVTPPYVTNPSPVPDASGVPLDANITFNISDSQSGVDLDSVTVNVDGIIYTKDGGDGFSYVGNAAEYSVAVNPAVDFTPGASVLVEINAADLDGNRMVPYRYIFNQPAVPPTPPSCEALGCAAPTTCATEPVIPEEITEEPTVPESQKLFLSDFSFYGAEGSIQLFPNRNDEITTLLNTSVIVSAAASKFPREVERIVLTVNSFSYLLGYNETADAYQTTIQMPAAAARFPLVISIDYTDDAHDRIDGAFLLLSKGYVWQGTATNRLSGARVTLHEESAGFRIWDATPYHQTNPQTTDANGQFAFLVPPGRYYLLVQKDGFRDEQTAVFEVANNVVNSRVEVIVKPPPLTEVWNPDAPLPENIQNVVKNIGEQGVYAGEVVQKEVLDNPVVEKNTENIATPAVAAVAIVSYGTAISLGSLLPFLQLIFTQPLLLLFPKRRKGWGIVYHSLSKMPVDLAIVRLYEKVTNRLVQTRVTDKEGRFAFFVQPGQYFIKVVKPNFSFPTAYLKDKKEDVKYLDIYHGEEITVTEKNTLVTPNIPVDPAGAERAVPDKRILLSYYGRKVQNIVAPLGIIFSAVAVIIVPQPWMIAVLLGHCLLYALFRRLARSKKPKSWGIVYESQTKAPIGLTVARIFEKEYNKLLETQVTDGRGRYSFLVGNNVYYVTFSKPGFVPKRSDEVDLRKSKEGAAVGLDVALEKKS